MKHAMFLIGGFVAIVAFADPVAIGTKSEVQAARGLIEDLVQSGTSADELVLMANDSTSGAERYCLYVNAFILQAKDGKYADAAKTLKALRENVSGVPGGDIVNLIERNARRGLADEPKLAAILKEVKATQAAKKLIAKLKEDVRKKPKDASFRESLGDALAVSGDWPGALKVYAELKGPVSLYAKAEIANRKSAKIASFWWNYNPKVVISGGATARTQMADLYASIHASTAFKEHAAGMYKKLVSENKISGVEKVLAERRISMLSGSNATSREVCATEKNPVVDKPKDNVEEVQDRPVVAKTSLPVVTESSRQEIARSKRRTEVVRAGGVSHGWVAAQSRPQMSSENQRKLLDIENAHEREMFKRRFGREPANAEASKMRQPIVVNDVRKLNEDYAMPSDVIDKLNSELKIKSFCGQDFGVTQKYLGENSGRGGQLQTPFRVFTRYTLWGSKFYRVGKIDLRGKVMNLSEDAVRAEIQAVAAILETKYGVKFNDDRSWGNNISKSGSDEDKEFNIRCWMRDGSADFTLSFKNKQVYRQNDEWLSKQPKKELKLSATEGADLL